MKANVSLSKQDNSKQLNDALRKISNLQVYVGIPESKASRRKPGINNPTLLAIHTKGSPLQNIPARPVIEPAIEAAGNKELIASDLKDAAHAVLEGNPGVAKQALNRAGTDGMNAARGWFNDPRNNWPPDKPATIRRKGSDQPLFDTGQLKRALTYVVKDSE